MTTRHPTKRLLYDVQNISIVHHANQALRAHTLFSRDTDYIVKDGKVVIIDEFTGRMMEGRRYSDGLHQALEAKEGVEADRESDARLDHLPELFSPLLKLAGMTGTAMTEAEFAEIYSLEVADMPTNMPMIRWTKTTRFTGHKPRSTTRSSNKSPSVMNGASPSWSARSASRSQKNCRPC